MAKSLSRCEEWITKLFMFSRQMCKHKCKHIPSLILGMHPANERLRYFVKTSLIAWAQT